jgi:thiol-disulfide isomerase/thioredoxin
MKANLKEIKEKTLSIEEYFESMKSHNKERFLSRKMSYKLKREAINALKKISSRFIFVAFSAEWCKDCMEHIPILALIGEETSSEIRVFGGLMTDPLNPRRIWRIPPSPPEVETFNITRTPTILVFNRKGNEVGRMTENPERTSSLEEELLEIIESKE